MIVAAMTIDGLQRPELPIAEAQASFLPSALLAVAAIGMGLLVPSALRLPMRDGVTIAVELIVKNVLLGVFIATRSLPFEAVVPILLFAAFQTPAGILLLVIWRLLARWGVVAPPPPREEYVADYADEIVRGT